MAMKLLSLLACLFVAFETIVAQEIVQQQQQQQQQSIQVIPNIVSQPQSQPQVQPTQLFVLPQGLSQFDIGQLSKTLNSYGGSYGQGLNQFAGQLGLIGKSGDGSFQLFAFDPSNFKGFEPFNQLTNQFSTQFNDQFLKSGISESKFFVDIQKYMNNPSALVDYVGTTFNLPRERLTVLLDREDLLHSDGHPVTKSMKILEKVFVPNGCRSKILCQISRQFGGFKDYVGRIPIQQYFEGSGYYKALNHGLIGEDCQAAYAACKQGDELILANPLASLSLYAGPTESKKIY